ncbi:MAG: hydantoinase B/oxoprolinase family protein [Chloroflexota bacterium]
MAKPGTWLKETEGLNFKELIAHHDQKLKEDGCYTKELHLKKEDPVKYDVLYAKLSQLLAGAKQTCMYISGSYAVREIGENLAALYTADGDVVAQSTGIFLHLHTMGRQVRYIKENDYETNPGVKEGDYFFNNDPHIGGQHTPDQNVVTPIFYGGRLIAWAGSMTHVVETGATTPGGVSPDAPNRFFEGLFVPAMKIAENDWLRADWEQMFKRNVRDATMWVLDVKGKFGTCMTTRDKIKALIDEYGVDYFSEVLREYVEDGRRTAIEKVRRMSLPGKYRARNFCDVDCGTRLKLVQQTNVELTIDRKGNLTLDLEGSSPEGPHPFQGSLACAEGSALCILLQYFFTDCRYNDGTLYAMDLRVPKGSIYWCNEQGATSRYIASPGSAQMSNLCEIFGRIYYLSAKFEEVLSPNPTTGPLLYMGGKSQRGAIFGTCLPDHGAEGMSALATRDGVATAYAMWQPEADMGNAESWENAMPIVYLGRYRRVDGGGLGKYRGGSGMDYMFFVHPNADIELGWASNGKYISGNQGFMGGYPGPSAAVQLARNTNLKELIEQRKPIPHRLGSPSSSEIARYVKGDLGLDMPANILSFPVPPYTICNNLQMGGSGFGDPLERDPNLILADLVQGVVTRESVEKVCGVVMEGDWSQPRTLKCNLSETEKLRDRMREERKKRGISARKYIEMQRARVLKGDIPKYPKEMINRLLKFSPRWASYFRKEWGLPADFKEVP